MKTASPSRLAFGALILLLGVVAAIAPTAMAGHHGGKGGHHGDKPKYLSCKPLADFDAAIKTVSSETGIAPDMGPPNFYKYPVGGGSPFAKVPSTECGLEWKDDIGNSSAYGNCKGCSAGEWLTCAAIGVSKHDFKKAIVGTEGPCSSEFGVQFTVEKYSPPGAGSQGYILEKTINGGAYPTDHDVYAWSKKKGCYIGFDAWPLSLEASEDMADKALAKC